MTIELLPVGQRCNLGCTYCYENDFRTVGNFGPMYNIDRMLAAVPPNEDFTLFGGEPLLVPLSDLRIFFERGCRGIQTNGVLITWDHIRLFKEFNIHVGVSIDGPGELNAARKLSSSPEKTHEATTKTIENIWSLRDQKVSTSLIFTIHRLNGIGEKRERLKKFMLWCHDLGIESMRIHFLENDNASLLTLTPKEEIEAFLDLKSLPIKFDVFQDIHKLLTEENPNVTCTWNGCDPYTTPAVHGINGDGTLSNCGRASKDGILFQKASVSGRERVKALYHTPQEFGGCKDCRFFYACKGECPGEAIDGDWRNRSSHCETFKALFADEESKIDGPISLNEHIRYKLEMKTIGKNSEIIYQVPIE